MNAPANPIITRRAPIGASTWNPETRTFEVVFSTGAPVERYDARGLYSEVLSLSQDWPNKVPFLDAHRRGSLDAVLGFADRLRTVGGEARATVRLSRHSALADRLAGELDDGNTFGISVGYTVEQFGRETADPKTGRRTRVATRWTPLEISVDLLPADRQATIRKDTAMTATPTPAPSPESTPAAAPVLDTTAAADRATVNAEIRSIARMAGLDQAWIDRQIDHGATADAARTAAFEAMRERSANANAVRTTTVAIVADHNDPEMRARTIGDALFARVNPAHTPTEAARPYVGLTIPELARDCLRTRGMATTGLSPAGVIERALHSTSDFPIILGDTVGRTLRQAYSAAPVGIRRLGRETTARDFRSKYRVQLSAAPTLEKVNEAGEFKSGTLGEAKESYAISTFGRIIGITRQALVNDDLGAFADLPRRMGQAAAAFEADFLVELLTTASGVGPDMNDGNPLFDAAHGNTAGSGGSISETTLSAGRLAMRKQTGLGGELIAVTPRYVLVPPDKETEAEKVLSAIQATKTSDVNVFSTLAVVVEPRLTGNRWYIVADPAEIDGLEYAYLEGEPGPQITTQAGFEIDGVQVKVRLDFGAGFVDWRGWYVNPGA